MRVRIDDSADLGEMQRHGMRVGPRHDEPRAFAFLRADGAENVGPFRALILWGRGPRPALGPAACDLVLLPDAGVRHGPRTDGGFHGELLPPDLDLNAIVQLVADLGQALGEVFLNSATASSFWA